MNPLHTSSLAAPLGGAGVEVEMKKDPKTKRASSTDPGSTDPEGSPDLERGELRRRGESTAEIDKKGKEEVERTADKIQESAAGKGLGDHDAADGQGAVTQLQGGDKIETLYGKVFIAINFFQVRLLQGR